MKSWHSLAAMICLLPFLIILTMSGSAMPDGDGGGMLLRFIPQRRWIHPFRNTGLTEEVRKHMEQNTFDGNDFHQLDRDERMPHVVLKKRNNGNLGLNFHLFSILLILIFRQCYVARNSRNKLQGISKLSEITQKTFHFLSYGLYMYEHPSEYTL